MELSDNIIQTVWEKARGIQDMNQNEWRQDQCGAWLQRDQYNNEASEYGWTILKVSPDASNTPGNLQPFHCRNSFDIATGKPQCHVTADRTDLAPGQSIDQPHNTGA